ncbi:MAG TPA: ligase-associated DNA damage response endonuclease PdeM [Casimicrobiaceae bacterium]|nr:ligase-associated DNA damage response endonuclease PdeM [Casimicrobiaceae bacterium]
MSSAAPELALGLPAVPVTGDTALRTTIVGEHVELHAERALHWPRMRTLFVADVHLGKAAAFRAGGVPVPRGATQSDLARLTRLVARTAAARVVILGDFFHARAGRVSALDASFMAWREQHAALEVTLVRGNHDRHAGDPPAHWNIACVADPHALPPFIGVHHPVAPPSGYALCGHIHPGVWIHGAGESARLPCFVIGARRAILPAFGRLTGLATIQPAPDETIVAIAGTKLFVLPRVAQA